MKGRKGMEQKASSAVMSDGEAGAASRPKQDPSRLIKAAETYCLDFEHRRFFASIRSRQGTLPSTAKAQQKRS